MSRKYMNRFAIEEDNQFEIHVKDYTDTSRDLLDVNDIYNAAKEVMFKAHQG